MPDDISSGDTLEGGVPVDTGDTPSSTDDATVNPPEEGTQPSADPIQEELPEALRDKYIPIDRYQNLESKLGNWSEVEKKAALYEQFSQDPRVQNALQPEPAQPEPLPDFSQMDAPKVLEYLDQRAEKLAQRLFDEKISQFKSENIDPMAKDVYTRQADEMVKGMESKYPDFKENKDAIAEFLDQNPSLAENLNEKSLEMAYRYVTWEKQQKTGADQAVKKLLNKSKETSVTPQGTAPAGKAKAKSIADAWAQAEEGTIN
jgi:hypothetical protein